MRGSEAPGPALFVSGFPRSGTTLMGELLNRHSRLCIPPETRFMEEFRDRLPGTTELASASGRRRIQFLTTATRARDLGVDSEALCAAFTDHTRVSHRQLLASLLDVYRRRQGKPLVGEKSPVHQFHLRTLAAWYPEARFIVMVRDGRDVIESLGRTPWGAKSRLWLAREWAHRDWQVKGDLRQLPGRVLVVRFEDLLADPPAVLARVMTFLGLGFEPAQLEPTQSALVPGWEREWKGNVNTALDPDRAYAWRRAPASDALMTSYLMRPALRRHGYETPPLSLARRLLLLPLVFPGIYPGYWKLRWMARRTYYRARARRTLAAMTTAQNTGAMNRPGL